MLIAFALMMWTSGCATFGFKSDEDALKKQVAFENTACPAEKIKVLRSLSAGVGHDKFEVDVCGTSQRWDRFGTSYFPEGKGPMAGRSTNM
jgi:hypothetical protein